MTLFYTYNQNNQFLCSKNAQNEDKWGYPLGNWMPYPLGNWIPYSLGNWMPCSLGNWMPCSLGNLMPCSYDLRIPYSYDLRIPCSYDLRIGIVMQLFYYVFVIFTATTATFEVKYLIIIVLSDGSRGGSRVAVVAAEAVFWPKTALFYLFFEQIWAIFLHLLC